MTGMLFRQKPRQTSEHRSFVKRGKLWARTSRHRQNVLGVRLQDRFRASKQAGGYHAVTQTADEFSGMIVSTDCKACRTHESQRTYGV